MEVQKKVVVAGLGEVGQPLLNILSRNFDCAGVDIEPVEIDGAVAVLHVCYPFQIPGYVRVTANYIDRFRPELTIIHTTVPPGTSRLVQSAAPGSRVAFSPVRGKHVRMQQDMLRYTKFVAGLTPEATTAALTHLAAAGFATATFPSPEIAELAKLLETSYLGVLIAWAQEMERLATQYGGTFEDVNRFVEEVDFLPSHIFPGVIGGHCVLPNIDLLRSRAESSFLDLVVQSNQLKRQQPAPVGAEVAQ